MRYSKRLLQILIVVCVIFGAARLYLKLTDDFRISNITYDVPYHPEWEIPPQATFDQDHVNHILNQDFFYVSKGCQCYVFESGDDRYVLKFFKFKHLKPSILFGILPKLPFIGKYQEKEILRKQKKLKSVFDGYKLAYDRIRSETGLIFIQLNPTHKERMLTVHDKLGFQRSIDLGEVVYVIQDKGTTLRNTLDTLLKEKNVAKAKRRIGQIFDLYMTEYQKGIYDRDHGVMHNTGFIGNKPFHLDVGMLTQDSNIQLKENYELDLQKIARKIKLWLSIHYPENYDEVNDFIENKMADLLK